MKNIATYLLLTAVLLAACGKQAIENTWAAQETKIENFVNARLSEADGSYAVYNNGTVRVTMTRGQGDSLKRGGLVSFYYAGYTLSGTSVSPSSLFWTNSQEIATAAGREITGDDTYAIETLPLDNDSFSDGLANGMEGVKAGGEYYILFSGKYGFGKRAVGTISAKSALVYHIWVESISNE